MKKEKYEAPVIEIILLDENDIIITSLGDLGDLGDSEGDVNPFDLFELF